MARKDATKEEKLLGIKKEFQESEAREATARDKIKEFEKANPFDIQPKGEIESGITPGKFKDPKKQEEYDKLQKESEARGLQSIKIKGKYREADVGKDVKPMSAAYAAQLNKQNEEANKAGRHPTGQPHRTDFKEGEETGLNDFEMKKKYTAALKERGVAGSDINVFNPDQAYNDQIKKELREKVAPGSPGAKTPVTAPSTTVLPVVEKKSVDTSVPGKAVAVAPVETVDGKKVRPVIDVEKAQQAAKEKYQAATSEEKAVSEKLKSFEKENQFDYREKPTATQDLMDMPGTGKFKDPKKQEEYDKLVEARYQASKSIKSAGAEYTAAEGVTKTQAFTGGMSKRGDKSGGLISDSKKIEGLKKRGYTDKDLGRDDTLTENFIQDGNAKYPLSNLGKYEAVIKKELATPIDAKVKDGQAIPNEAVVTPAGTPSSSGPAVVRASTENADMERDAKGRGGANNTVVSNNVSNNSTTKIVPMKANPRPEYTGSSLDRYTNRITVY
jgi:hypothetical protein